MTYDQNTWHFEQTGAGDALFSNASNYSALAIDDFVDDFLLFSKPLPDQELSDYPLPAAASSLGATLGAVS